MRQGFYLAFYRLIEHELMHIISQSVSDVQQMQFYQLPFLWVYFTYTFMGM